MTMPNLQGTPPKNTPTPVNLFAAYDPKPPTAFRMPPMPCGDYTSTSAAVFGDVYEFSFRRMPRKKGYEGKYGLWWKSKDEGKVLLAVYVYENARFERIDKIKEHDLPWSVWTAGAKKLVHLACGWCGRELEGLDRLIHENCEKKTK